MKSLKLILFTCLITSCINTNATINQSTYFTFQDSVVFARIIEKSQLGKWSLKPINEVIIHIATYFSGTPYVASTLETSDEEHLIVNLRQMDCTTFVENVIALARCIKSDKTKMSDFTAALTQIRYRDGIINQYPSRLHYFTEWMTNNQKKGIITLMSDSLGDKPFDSKVDFMSSHASSYAALSNNCFLTRIQETEANISALKLRYITTNQLPVVEKKICDGDIIAFSTTIEGLDISHIAIACRQNGKLCFIHASTTAGKVIISQKTVNEYLTGSKLIDGILVGRVTELW